MEITIEQIEKAQKLMKDYILIINQDCKFEIRDGYLWVEYREFVTDKRTHRTSTLIQVKRHLL